MILKESRTYQPSASHYFVRYNSLKTVILNLLECITLLNSRILAIYLKGLSTKIITIIKVINNNSNHYYNIISHSFHKASLEGLHSFPCSLSTGTVGTDLPPALSLSSYVLMEQKISHVPAHICSFLMPVLY